MRTCTAAAARPKIRIDIDMDNGPSEVRVQSRDHVRAKQILGAILDIYRYDEHSSEGAGTRENCSEQEEEEEGGGGGMRAVYGGI